MNWQLKFITKSVSGRGFSAEIGSGVMGKLLAASCLLSDGPISSWKLEMLSGNLPAIFIQEPLDFNLLLKPNTFTQKHKGTYGAALYAVQYWKL